MPSIKNRDTVRLDLARGSDARSVCEPERAGAEADQRDRSDGERPRRRRLPNMYPISSSACRPNSVTSRPRLREAITHVVQAAPAVLERGARPGDRRGRQEGRSAQGTQRSVDLALPARCRAHDRRFRTESTCWARKPNRKLAEGIDLDAAKSAFGDATSLWSKAQAAFGNGNMDEAVTAAKEVKSKLADLATSLKLDLAAPAAAP